MSCASSADMSCDYQLWSIDHQPMGLLVSLHAYSPTMLQSFINRDVIVSACVFEQFFVNKSLFAVTKVDFPYFGHIFVCAAHQLEVRD